MELIYTKNHEQTMVCRIKLPYQKLYSVQKSCSGKTFCQKYELIIIHPHFFKLNENARTFIQRLSETSLIRFFIFTTFDWVDCTHDSIVREDFILSFVLYIVIVTFKLFLTVIPHSNTPMNNPFSGFFTFCKTSVQF